MTPKIAAAFPVDAYRESARSIRQSPAFFRKNGLIDRAGTVE